MQKEEQVLTYIEDLIPRRTDQFIEMEEYAKKNDIPIMELIGIESLLQILRIQQPKKILEIGTAIGYSALRMAESLPNCQIVTIERDHERYLLAKEYVQKQQKESQVTLIYGDALEVEDIVQAYGPFDALFIDAAKGQYRKFFDLYTKYLSETSIIFTDNVLFHGLVAAEKVESRNVRQLVRKINHYNKWLMEHPEYYTVILPVGDGIAISKKRG